MRAFPPPSINATNLFALYMHATDPRMRAADRGPLERIVTDIYNAAAVDPSVAI